MSKRAVNVLRKMAISYASPTWTGIAKHTNASGDYVNGRNVVVKTATAAVSAQLLSGPIYVPANSVIRSITCVITAPIVLDSGSRSLGVRAGNAVADATYCALVVNSLGASGTGPFAAGVGTSSDTVLSADLGGNSALALGANYIASAGEIHVEMQPNTGTLTSGAVSFIVEFDYLGGN